MFTMDLFGLKMMTQFIMFNFTAAPILQVQLSYGCSCPTGDLYTQQHPTTESKHRTPEAASVKRRVTAASSAA